MASGWRAMSCLATVVLAIVLVTAVGGSEAADCSTLIMNLADCLSYVTSGSTVEKPEGTCCSGLKTVIRTGPECLCEAFKSSASMGVTLNVTKSAALPHACNVPTPPSARCALSVVPPASAPGTSPTASAGAPDESAGPSVAAPVPTISPGTSSSSSLLSVSYVSFISGLIALLVSHF